MACGAGLYAAAIVATFIVIIAMVAVGFIERRANLKAYNVTYEARGSDQLLILQGILDAMDKHGQRLSDVETNAIGNVQRVTFPLSATNGQHARIKGQLRAEPGISQLLTFRDPEDD
jgi:uncharacterized membrane protein YhiD involved in acid resistance